MNYKNENIKIFIKDDWVSYEKMRKLVGGFHYSSAIRFYDNNNEYFYEIKSKEYSSIAFPFYFNSDPTKRYEHVFKNKFLNKEFPFYIYDEYLLFLKQLLEIEKIKLEKNIYINVDDLNTGNYFK